VRTLLDRSLGAGNIVATWNGRDDAGRAVPSGVYLVQLRAGAHRESRKLTLLK
jgi:flagellar hook assembly protein FlgD